MLCCEAGERTFPEVGVVVRMRVCELVGVVAIWWVEEKLAGVEGSSVAGKERVAFHEKREAEEERRERYRR